ncbi:hypothetical protein OAI86_07065 [Alphaproteobacteria bacterium]|nr:hypothetical protein [Alphaproteobacteria bacterium]
MKLNNTFNNICLFLGCLGIVLFFRIIPHPPNFTPVIAMSFYLPLFFGLGSLPFIILAFAITDYFIGLHSLLIWTWGGLVIIGIISKFGTNIFLRVLMTITSALIFFIISNFGVWLTSMFYSPNLQGLMNCYIMGLPFFGNTLLSTLLFGALFEFFIKSKPFFSNLFLRKIN